MALSILSENYINFRTAFTLLAGIFLITGGINSIVDQSYASLQKTEKTKISQKFLSAKILSIEIKILL